MDILSVATLDLSEFGIEGHLKFRRMPASRAVEYRERSEELKEKSTGEQVTYLKEVIDEYFVGGEIKQGDEVVKVEQIGEIDMGVLSEAITLIAGTENKKKSSTSSSETKAA